jgi:3-oxoacyl-[acyl-carrier protein] reductase
MSLTIGSWNCREKGDSLWPLQRVGFACDSALAQAVVKVTLNGRDRQSLLAATNQIFETRNKRVQIAVADIGTELGQDVVLAKCPHPDILINNNGGPPFVEFQSLSNNDIEKGLEMTIITPKRITQNTLDSMIARGFGRIVNISSVSVKMSIQGLDLSRGARAGLSSFLA